MPGFTVVSKASHSEPIGRRSVPIAPFGRTPPNGPEGTYGGDAVRGGRVGHEVLSLRPCHPANHPRWQSVHYVPCTGLTDNGLPTTPQ